MERFKKYARNRISRIGGEFKVENEKEGIKDNWCFQDGCMLKGRPCSVNVVLEVGLKMASGSVVKDEGGDKKWP